MDNLGSILHNRQYDEPDEVRLIKQYVQEKFQTTVSVSLTTHAIVITASSAALAGSLRPHLHHLQTLCDTKKRILIRIGQ